VLLSKSARSIIIATGMSAAPAGAYFPQAALHVRKARVRLMDMLQRASVDPED
jgi:hypothetical protein